MVVEAGTVVVAPTAFVDGDTRVTGGTLAGTAGQFSNGVRRLVVDAGGTLAPAAGGEAGEFRPQSLTLNPGSTFRVRVGLPGGTADAISLPRPPAIADAVLRVAVPGRVGHGDVFTVLRNTDVGIVSGTFAGLPEGATVLDEGGRYASPSATPAGPGTT